MRGYAAFWRCNRIPDSIPHMGSLGQVQTADPMAQENKEERARKRIALFRNLRQLTMALTIHGCWS